MRWNEFEASEPRLAALGRERLLEPGVVLVGTIRRDGSPRISPVEPLLWEGDLWLSMMWGSFKAADLKRDPRVLVHSIVTGRDGAAGEYKLRGGAIEEGSHAVQSGYAREVRERIGWDPEPGRFHLFRVDIADVTFIRYEEEAGDQFVTRWPARREFVRRGTSATSLGERQPYEDLLAGP
jgi:Pyridoxamine 5'-phosphate oxidase